MKILSEDITEFLRNIPPFHDLDEATLRNISVGISTEFYPKGSLILRQDGPASDYLRIIQKGSVKVFISSGQEDRVLIDTRSEGESFGFLSLMSGDKARANVVAVEDTTCFLVSREAVLKILETNPPFAEYFLLSYLNKYIDKAHHEMGKKRFSYGGGDSLLFTTPIGELVRREPITAPQDISIKGAAEIMTANKISCLILLDSTGIPTGIVTDRDLRDKVISKERSFRESIKNIMSVFLIKADARDYCFEALLKMIRYNVHHLLVIESGILKGVITNHDLMMLQGTSPISLVREIEGQQSIEGLIPVSKKVNKIVELLMKEGAKASNITRIITEINDRLLRKVLEITEKKLGTPPLEFCWIVFGSEGRKEQTFKTDQDNAIVYVDADSEEKDEAAREYLSAFTLLVRDGMSQCGFPSCPADYMASNPKWCQPLKVWKKYFAGWINEPTPDAVLKSLIFFDFRPLYGKVGLAEDLRDSLAPMVEGQRLFLGYMANTIIKKTPPLGFFRSFVVEKSGKHKDKFDLKVKGIAPLVDAVRLFALEKNVRETSTLERIDALKHKHTIVQEYADELEHAFEVIMLLRIHHQFEQIEAGREPDNFINPNTLNNLEKRLIREAFHRIAKIQGLIIDKYKTMIL
ncbi:MAG TPA: DUF294 nucleotidyltransferase-like domain-containing protein [Thermodesulfovibrionales bacterium]|nr:DUF294 nucleotidyltransferase-like domain-containing protein [Thermodesulfovibrionales bacterium]